MYIWYFSLIKKNQMINTLPNNLVSFGLNLAAVSVVKHTSTLTLSLAGVLKDMLIIVISMWRYSTPLTSLQAIGYGVSLIGLAYYKTNREPLWQKVFEMSDPRKFNGISKVLIGVIFILMAFFIFNYSCPDSSCGSFAYFSSSNEIAQEGSDDYLSVERIVFTSRAKAAMIVEDRPLNHLNAVILQILATLGNEWKCKLLFYYYIYIYDYI